MSQAQAMGEFQVNDLLIGGASITGVGVALWKILSMIQLSVKGDGAAGKVLDSVMRERDTLDEQLDDSRKREQITFDALRVEQNIVLDLRRDQILAEGKIAQLEEALQRLAAMVIELNPNARPRVAQWLEDSGYPPLGLLDVPTRPGQL